MTVLSGSSGHVGKSILVMSSWRPPAAQLLPENAGKAQGNA
jgi:hypothetical protein